MKCSSSNMNRPTGSEKSSSALDLRRLQDVSTGRARRHAPPRRGRSSCSSSSLCATAIGSRSTYTTRQDGSSCWTISCRLPAVGRPEPMSRNCRTPDPTMKFAARRRNARLNRAASRTPGMILLIFSAELPVGGEVGVAVEPEVVHPRRVRHGGVDLRRYPAQLPGHADLPPLALLGVGECSPLLRSCGLACGERYPRAARVFRSRGDEAMTNRRPRPVARARAHRRHAARPLKLFLPFRRYGDVVELHLGPLPVYMVTDARTGRGGCWPPTPTSSTRASSSTRCARCSATAWPPPTASSTDASAAWSCRPSTGRGSPGTPRRP